MKALIYIPKKAVERGNDFFDIESSYLLKICNKYLIEYFIDFCSVNNIEELRIITNSSEVEKLISAGEKYGIKISYSLAKPGDSLSVTVGKNYDFLKDEEVIIFKNLFLLTGSYKKKMIFPEKDSAVKKGEGEVFYFKKFQNRKEQFEQIP